MEEENEQGQTKMNIFVNPRLGDIDEVRLIRFILDELAKGGDAPRMMSQIWLQTETLRVKRMKPITTTSGKLLPLHIQKVKQHEL